MRTSCVRAASSTDLRADHVRSQERAGIVDAPIDVRFGGGVDHRVGVGDQSVDQPGIDHVAQDEAQAWIAVVRFQVRAAPARGEPVEHRDRRRGTFQQRIDEVGADEAGAARDEDVVSGAMAGPLVSGGGWWTTRVYCGA